MPDSCRVKIKLVGLGNDEGRDYFVFSKEDSFLESFPLFLDRLCLGKTPSLHEYGEEPYPISEKSDLVERTSNHAYDVDLFYGKARIIIVVRSDEEHRPEVLDAVKAIAEFEGFEKES